MVKHLDRPDSFDSEDKNFQNKNSQDKKSQDQHFLDQPSNRAEQPLAFQSQEPVEQVDQTVGGDNAGLMVGVVKGGRLIVHVHQQVVNGADGMTVTTRVEGGRLGPNPYRGLAAFQETDAERFFGRESSIRLLRGSLKRFYEAPQGLRFLAIYGPSGSGKSSLARAGVLPRLVREPLPGYEAARVIVMVPGQYPLESLAGALARALSTDTGLQLGRPYRCHYRYTL